MSAKFTPGPWEFELYEKGEPVRPDIWRIYGGDDSYEATIAELWSGEHDNQANARLIAAAPELYKALRRIVENPEARIGGQIRAEAVAALAKAEDDR